MAVVDCRTALFSLLDDISDLPREPPSLYLELEGVRLGRHGSLSIISLFVRPKKNTYLIDVQVLGSAAFSTTNSHGVSLQTILEFPHTPKVVFDSRSVSDALFSHYQICINGVKDLQLMELASRTDSKKRVAELARCVHNDGLVSPAAKAGWQRTKKYAIQPVDPKRGSPYEVFVERPIRPEIKEYCAGDVNILPGLYDVYNAKLRPPGGGGAFWRVQVRRETQNRITLSQHPRYDPEAKSKIYGPWDGWSLEQAIEEWNEEIMFNAMTGDMVLDENDNWV